MRVTTLRFVLASMLVLASLGGCQTAPPQRVYAPDDATPRCQEDARWWEHKAERELEHANDTDSIHIRVQHIDYAIRDLRVAKDDYYTELLGLESQATREHPIPFARRNGLETQIERLERQIDLVYSDRPVIGEPVR